MIQALLGFGVLSIHAGEKNLRMGIITCHFHACDGHQTHTRVFDLEPDQFGYFTLYLLRDAIGSGKVDH